MLPYILLAPYMLLPYIIVYDDWPVDEEDDVAVDAVVVVDVDVDDEGNIVDDDEDDITDVVNESDVVELIVVVVVVFKEQSHIHVPLQNIYIKIKYLFYCESFSTK